MSKMDNLRAMREARYERAQSGGTTARRTLVAPAKSAPEPEASAAEGLCGHRNMSGRTCTRESGHAAKSHRYS
jgi:hypothetical protein